MVILVRESDFVTANQVHKQIPEFNEPDYLENNKEILTEVNVPLIVVAFDKSTAVGYMIGFDRDHDGSYYLWMAGVLPWYRQKGVMTKLMNYLYVWARKKGYTKLKVKTRNDKKAMIIYMMKEGFDFTKVEVLPNVGDTKLHLEKLL